jgi:hypothetical protein
MGMSMKHEGYVSVGLGSLLVNHPENVIRAWARAGKVKAYKQGGRWLIHRQSLGNYALRLVADSRATEIEPDSKGYGLGCMQVRGAS